MKLWIGNLPPGTSNQAVRELVRKYTRIEIDCITEVDSDSIKPGVLISIGDEHPIDRIASHAKLELIQHRLDHLYWKQHRLSVHLLTHSDLEPGVPLAMGSSTMPD